MLLLVCELHPEAECCDYAIKSSYTRHYFSPLHTGDVTLVSAYFVCEFRLCNTSLFSNITYYLS